MKLVLNIGMHKTGTSSIQNSLAKFDDGQTAYLQLGHPNHSAIYATMFLERPETYHAHRKNGRDVAAVQEIRDTFIDRYETGLAVGRGTIISSAEDVVLLPESDLITMRDWLEERFDEIHLIGYLRPPASFMASALQQRIVGGLPQPFKGLYPEYRRLFEKFDRVFGRERVSLVKFDRAHLREGDVVRDFAHRAGVTLDPAAVLRSNESRSLETSAALFVQRELGRGFQRYPGAPRDNQRLVSALMGIGRQTKIKLHPELVGSLLAPHAEDLAWAAERLGTDFADPPPPEAASDPAAIRGKEDLIRVAGDQLSDVLQVIRDEVGERSVDPALVATAVDLLLDVLRTAPRRPKAGRRAKA